MATALIVGGLLLVGLGLVASQLFRLRDWLNRQPPPSLPPADDDPSGQMKPEEQQ